MKSNVIDVDVELTARTDRAVLVHTGNMAEAVWLPLSQIELSPSGFTGIETVTLPDWLAEEKGLV